MMEFDHYVYPGTNILKNKQGVMDAQAAYDSERLFSLKRVSEFRSSGVTGRFDSEHLKAIHKFLFQDVYDWAGEFRDIEIFKGTSGFETPDRICSELDGLFSDIRNKNYFRGLSKQDAANGMADAMCRLNAIHPFREGNLSVGEKDANRILGVLEDKRCLSKDDMARLYGFVSSQILRVPMFMDCMQDYLFSDLSDSLDYYSRNQVLYSSFLSDEAVPERSILGWNMWNLCGHQMYVLNSKSPFLLCGDAPVQFLFWLAVSEFPVIVFPVSRFQCLLFVSSNGICLDGIYIRMCATVRLIF